MASRARSPEPEGVLSLQNWALEAQAAAGIAKALAPTAFVPDHLRVWTNPAERDPAKRILDLDGTVAQVTAVLLAGQELEFGPMASLRAFVIIRGTVALYAIAARALLLRHGHEIIVAESTSSRAIVRGRRAGSDEWQVSTWDLDRARTAGLFPGHVDGNWRKQTKAMLVARATAEASRWVAADAMLGLPLIAEEVDDHMAGVSDGQAPDDEAEAPAAASKTAKRKTAAARAALPAAPLVAPEQQQSPDPPSSEPPPGTPRPTKAQLAKLHAGLREMRITGAEEGLALVSAWAGRRITSTGHLTRPEMDAVLDRITGLLSLRDNDQREDVPPDHDEPPPGGAPEEGGGGDAEPEQ
jgi:hypothetical protein